MNIVDNYILKRKIKMLENTYSFNIAIYKNGEYLRNFIVKDVVSEEDKEKSSLTKEILDMMKRIEESENESDRQTS